MKNHQKQPLIKKLILNKTTIRKLMPDSLKIVAGGSDGGGPPASVAKHCSGIVGCIVD